MFIFFTFLLYLGNNHEKKENNFNSSCEYNSISYFTYFINGAFSVLILNIKSWCAHACTEFLNCCSVFCLLCMRIGQERSLQDFRYLKSDYSFCNFSLDYQELIKTIVLVLDWSIFPFFPWIHTLVIWCLLFRLRGLIFGFSTL